MVAERWDPATYALWHGSAPMAFLLEHVGPADMWVRGEGAWLVDVRGSRYLDGRSGVGNMMLGYSRTDIVDAMHRQAQSLPFACTMRYERAVPVVVEYAEALVKAAPAGLSRVRFTHTGSSAVESAVLMARCYHRNLGHKDKKVVVGLRDSYHGSTMTAMAASGQPMNHWYFGPMPEGFRHIPEPRRAICSLCTEGVQSDATCVAELQAALDGIGVDQIAAVIVEPVKGRNGIPLPDHYLHALRALCTRHDIVLIFDEVFTGFGRMGTLFAAEISGVSPDIMCLAKGITAGYAALGAVLATDRVYEAFNTSVTSYFAHGSSTDAHPIACAAGLATLDAFAREESVAHGCKVGERLRDRLADLLMGSPRFVATQATGAFVSLDLVDPDGRPASMITKRFLEAACHTRGVLIDYTPDTVMLIPPLILSMDEVDLLAEAVAETVLDFNETDIDESLLRPPTLRGHR